MTVDSAPATEPIRRWGDRGSGLVAGLAVLFAFTFSGLVWLARDVDRGVSNRSAAHSIAFQAARAGAQASDVATLRGDGVVSIEPEAARSAVVDTAAALLAAYGLEGDIAAIEVTSDRVSVRLAVTDAGITVTGQATVRSERTP